MTPIFREEVQFLRYGDGSRTGPTITLRLPERDYLDAFVGKEGRRFAAVLIEIGDDEKPVDAIPDDKPKGGPLAKWAAMRGQDPEFQEWLMAYSPDAVEQRIKKVCQVESRAELDNDPRAAAVFKQQFIDPWRAYCEQKGVK